MAKMFELETNYKGYKVRALPYYLHHEDSLRVLVWWEAYGGDLSLTVDLLCVDDSVVIYGLYGHTDSPEKLIPKVLAYGPTVAAECVGEDLLRWMGDTATLVRVWKKAHQDKLARAARARETLDAA